METTMDTGEALTEGIKTGIAALVAMALGWVTASWRKADRKDVTELEQRLMARITTIEGGQHTQTVVLAEIKTTLRQIQRDLSELRRERTDYSRELED